VTQHHSTCVKVDNLPQLLLNLRQILVIDLVSHRAYQVGDVCSFQFLPLFWLIIIILVEIIVFGICLEMSYVLSTNSLTLSHLKVHANIFSFELLSVTKSVIWTTAKLSQEFKLESHGDDSNVRARLRNL